MADKNNTNIYICVPQQIGNTTIILQCLALPFHLLIIKILAKDLRLALPRHKIMFSLSLSDCALIFVTFFNSVLMRALRLTTESMACQIMRQIVLFTVTLSMVVSGMTIIVMSIERYIACVHSFQLHKIMTKETVLFVLCVSWIIGAFCGITAVATNKAMWAEVAVADTFVLKVTTIISSFSTSIVITIIQIRLLIFSRSKLVRDRPPNDFGTQAELADFRKKQIKVAFVACIVAAAYVVCMLPLAVLYFCELVDGTPRPASLKTGLLALSLANTLADPFIYGIGTVDTRKLILKDLKKIKNAVSNCVR